MRLKNITDNKVIGVFGEILMPGDEIVRPREYFIVKVDKTDEYGDVVKKENGVPYKVEVLLPSIAAQVRLNMLQLDGNLDLQDEYESAQNGQKQAFMNEPEEVSAEDEKAEEIALEKTKRKSRKKAQ